MCRFLDVLRSWKEVELSFDVVEIADVIEIEILWEFRNAGLGIIDQHLELALGFAMCERWEWEIINFRFGIFDGEHFADHVCSFFAGDDAGVSFPEVVNFRQFV